MKTTSTRAESLESLAKKKRTSAAVKNRWNAAHYDKIVITAPKGWKAMVKTAANKENNSLAGFIREAVDKKILGGGKDGDLQEEKDGVGLP